MKYLIILGDGMADEAIAALGGKTPMQAASTPCMDMLAREGRCGRLITVPDGFPPGSEIANLSLLGYDLNKQFEGRGVLEAASMGVDIPLGFMAARCNLISVQEGKIKNHSAGHISTAEAAELMAFLNQELGDEEVSFHTGVSYRHLLLLQGGNKQIYCTPPHDVPGTPYADVLPQALNAQAEQTVQRLSQLILRSQDLLSDHPVNLARQARGLDPANSIWPWSPGYRPAMQPLSETYPIRSGSVISAVDLIKGIGVYAGLDVIEVPGATGLYDTNYEGKARAAIDELQKKRFCFCTCRGYRRSRSRRRCRFENPYHRIFRSAFDPAHYRGHCYLGGSRHGGRFARSSYLLPHQNACGRSDSFFDLSQRYGSFGFRSLFYARCRASVR